jgi:NADPH:quinone reductase-like Zn-dependent oxidoreductase
VGHLTGKHRVDLVVEHVGGRIFEQLFDCLERGGTIVTCGATTGREPTLVGWVLEVVSDLLSRHRQSPVPAQAEEGPTLLSVLTWDQQPPWRMARLHPL